jgi:hypothetical protein
MVDANVREHSLELFVEARLGNISSRLLVSLREHDGVPVSMHCSRPDVHKISPLPTPDWELIERETQR